MLSACAAPDARGERGLPEEHPRDASHDLALVFDGEDDYASTGTARFPFVRDPQTLSLWVKPAGGSSGLECLFVWREELQSGIEFALDSGVPVAFNVYGPRDLARGTAALTPEWHHLAYTFDGSTHRLYVDGELSGTSDQTPTNRTPTSAFIGSFDGFREFFHGELDALRLWDAVLSPEEITADGGDQRAVQPEARVLNLPFDEPSGARVYDRSGVGNHGELGDGVSARMPRRASSARALP